MARNGGTLKKSGWQKHHQARREGAFQAAAAEPIAWERLLGELAITEEFAVIVAQGRAEGPRLRLRNWVRLQRRVFFVPEVVLAALGFPVYEGEACAEPEGYITNQMNRDHGVRHSR